MEVSYTTLRPPISALQTVLKPFELNQITQPIGNKGYLLRFLEVDEAKHQKILAALGGVFKDQREDSVIKGIVEGAFMGDDALSFFEKTGAEIVTEVRFESIGPSIGKELQDKSVVALILVLAAIVIYVSWAFRSSSGVIAPWQYGIVALLTLFHDVLITLGVFAVLGQFYSVEVGAAFIAAILTILGYSVNDTVVVFDRIRENIRRLSEKDFGKLVGLSLNQTFARSFNTSFTVLLVLIAIFLFGGESLRSFTGALLIGIGVGTYSSLFVASPLLVDIEKRRP